MWRCAHVFNFFFFAFLIKVPDDGSDLLKQEAELLLAPNRGVGRYTSFIQGIPEITPTF